MDILAIDVYACSAGGTQRLLRPMVCRVGTDLAQCMPSGSLRSTFNSNKSVSGLTVRLRGAVHRQREVNSCLKGHNQHMGVLEPFLQVEEVMKLRNSA